MTYEQMIALAKHIRAARAGGPDNPARRAYVARRAAELKAALGRLARFAMLKPGRMQDAVLHAIQGV